MKLLKSFLYFTLCVVTVLSLENQNYYWEKYDGKIPYNAVLAGKNECGNLLYIGKTDKFGKEVPGGIEVLGLEEGSISLHIVNNAGNKKYLTVKGDIKILCAEFPEQMEWITVTDQTFRHISNRNIVMGGSYDSSNGGFPYLIGRKSYTNKVIVGGVTTSDFEMELIAQDGSEVVKLNVKKGIELLSYNPYLPKHNGEASLQPGSGYYWENYEGFIPEQAVPGGVSSKGTPTYIGQVYFNNTIVCGDLNSKTKSLNFVHYEVAYTLAINIKILCAHHPQQMEWIDTDSSNYWFQWQRNLVIGGNYGLYPYLVGRKAYEDRTVVGAAIRHGYTAGLHLAYDDTIKVPNSFQILSYNPFIPIKHNAGKGMTVESKSGNTYYINFY